MKIVLNKRSATQVSAFQLAARVDGPHDGGMRTLMCANRNHGALRGGVIGGRLGLRTGM